MNMKLHNKERNAKDGQQTKKNVEKPIQNQGHVVRIFEILKRLKDHAPCVRPNLCDGNAHAYSAVIDKFRVRNSIITLDHTAHSTVLTFAIHFYSKNATWSCGSGTGIIWRL